MAKKVDKMGKVVKLSRELAVELDFSRKFLIVSKGTEIFGVLDTSVVPVDTLTQYAQKYYELGYRVEMSDHPLQQILPYDGSKFPNADRYVKPWDWKPFIPNLPYNMPKKQDSYIICSSSPLAPSSLSLSNS